MSDDRIRELERRWRETSAPDDEARWLQERLRQGDLSRERVRLAAFLEHPAAAAVEPLAVQTWPKDAEARLRAWAKDLSGHGAGVSARAAVAEGHHKLGIVLRRALEPGVAEAHQACVRLVVRRLEALEDWILGGAPDRLDAFRSTLAPIPFALEADLQRWAYDQAIELTEHVAGWSRGKQDAQPRYGTWWASDFPPDEAMATQAAIRSELLPWALGQEDPLRTRLERIGVASPCSEGWGDMQGDAQRRHCATCDLDVYDLSAMKRAEAEALIRQREGRLCVRFFRREDGTVITSDCPIGLEDELDRHRSPYPGEFMMGDIAIEEEDLDVIVEPEVEA